MTTFYFVRHGHMDTSMAGKKFYKDFSYNMMTLSEKGIGQIKETAKDVRLANAELIIASPFGRTLHSAAILSKELNIDMYWSHEHIYFNKFSLSKYEKNCIDLIKEKK